MSVSFFFSLSTNQAHLCWTTGSLKETKVISTVSEGSLSHRNAYCMISLLKIRQNVLRGCILRWANIKIDREMEIMYVFLHWVWYGPLDNSLSSPLGYSCSFLLMCIWFFTIQIAFQNSLAPLTQFRILLTRWASRLPVLVTSLIAFTHIFPNMVLVFDILWVSSLGLMHFLLMATRMAINQKD